MEKLEPLYIAIGIVKWCSYFGNILVVSQKVTIWPSNFALYPGKLKIYVHKNLNMNVHSSIILIAQKVKTTQLSVNWWMDKQNVVQPYNGISGQFSCSDVSKSLWPHGLQHARPPCPLLTPGIYSNSCPLSRWCLPTISSSVMPFSCLQSFPASGCFQMSQFFSSGGQNIRVLASASVLPMNVQDWFPLGWTGWISNITSL